MLNLVVSRVPACPEMLGFRGSLGWEGQAPHRVAWLCRVGLTSGVGERAELRKCLSVICIWSRDRWWSLEEGKSADRSRGGGGPAQLHCLLMD